MKRGLAVKGINTLEIINVMTNAAIVDVSKSMIIFIFVFRTLSREHFEALQLVHFILAKLAGEEDGSGFGEIEFVRLLLSKNGVFFVCHEI